MKSDTHLARSKLLLIDSLLELMDKDSYHLLTVSEISDNAKLSRRTFYRHFNAKTDLLGYYLNLLINEYRENLTKMENLKLPEISKVFINFSIKYRKILLLFKRDGLLFLLLEKLNKEIPKIYNELKGALGEYESERDSKLVLAFSVGGHMNLLFHLLEYNQDISADHISKLLHKSLLLNL